MPWAPQGLEKLGLWRQKIGDMPLVAIGGMTPERGVEALRAGADSAAVVTDIRLKPVPKAGRANGSTQLGCLPQRRGELASKKESARRGEEPAGATAKQGMNRTRRAKPFVKELDQFLFAI